MSDYDVAALARQVRHLQSRVDDMIAQIEPTINHADPMHPPFVWWDAKYDGGLATFSGPGGFTQYRMPRENARTIADVFGVPFREWSS
jgi:hypothetical protein